MPIRPVVLCALDEASEAIAAAVEQAIKRRSPDAAKLVARFGLPPGCDRLCSSDDSPAALLDRFAEHADAFATSLGAALDGITDLDTRNELRRRGIAIGAEPQILILGPLGSAGAAATWFSVARACHAVLARKYAREPMRTHAVLLAPELVNLDAGEQVATGARGYAQLKEIDLWASQPDLVSAGGRLPFDFHWIIDRRTDAGETIRDFGDLLPAVAGALSSLALDELFHGANETLKLHLLEEAQGRRTHYSTFGFAEMVFDRARLQAYLAARLGEETLNAGPLRDDPLEPLILTLEVGRWMRENRLDKARQQIEEPDGAPLLQRFTFRAPRDGERARDFLVDLVATAERWQKADLDRAVQQVSESRAAFSRRVAASVDGTVRDRIDRAGTSEADAWLKLLLGESSRFLGEEPFDRELDLPAIEAGIHGEVERYLGLEAPRDALRNAEREVREIAQLGQDAQDDLSRLTSAFDARRAELAAVSIPGPAVVARDSEQIEDLPEFSTDAPPDEPGPATDHENGESIEDLHESLQENRNQIDARRSELRAAEEDDRRSRRGVLVGSLAVGVVAAVVLFGLLELPMIAAAAVALASAAASAAVLDLRRRSRHARQLPALAAELEELTREHGELKERIGRTREAVVRQVGSQSPSTVSPEPAAHPEDDLELQGLALRVRDQRAAVDELGRRLREAVIERDALRSQVDRINRRIADPGERRQALEERVQEIRKGIETERQRLEELDARLDDARIALRRAREERRRFLIDFVLLYPFLAAAVVAASAAVPVLGGWVSPEVLTGWLQAASWPAILLATVYVGFGVLRYWQHIAPGVRHLLATVRSLERDRESGMLLMPGRWDAYFRESYQAHVLDQLLGWLKRLRQHLEQLNQALETLRLDLEGLEKHYSEERERSVPVHRLFHHDVFQLEDYQRIYESDLELGSLVASFFREPRPRVSQCLGHSLDRLDAAIQDFSRAHWSGWLNLEVEEALEKATAAGLAPVHQLTALVDAAAPLLRLVTEEEAGVDEVGRADLVGTSKEDSRAVALIREAGRNPQTVVTADPGRISYCRIVHGFPAYHLGTIRRWHEEYRETNAADLHSVPSFVHAPDPIPSAIDIGPAWDSVRQVVAPAIALGHIVQLAGIYRYQEVELGASRHELYASLRHFRHIDRFNHLSRAVRADLGDETAEARLKDFLRERGTELDEVELQIIREICDQYSAL